MMGKERDFRSRSGRWMGKRKIEWGERGWKKKEKKKWNMADMVGEVGE